MNNVVVSSVLPNLDIISDLWTECQLWVIEAPEYMRPVLEIEAGGESLFPTILLSSPSAGQHMSTILKFAHSNIFV